MLMRPGAKRRTIVVTTAAAAITALSLAGASAPMASAAKAHKMTPAVGAHPTLVSAGAVQSDGQVKFGCQTVRPGRLTCYGPDQIRAAYSIQPLLDKGKDGKGRTIVIVDAFSPPGAASDLAHFSAVWGLPDANLTIVAPQGGTPWDPTDGNQVGWAEETNLDLQWAHAVAPGAKIVLVQANTNNDDDILAATQYAIDHKLGDVISQSFGEDERCVDPAIFAAQTAAFKKATREGISLFASSGDQGSAQPTCDGNSYSLAASSPAADANVTGVGGTSLYADLTSGAYQGETVWNESQSFGAAGGGGYSVLVKRPGYQGDVVKGRFRAVPDIAYNGGINNGVLAYLGPDVLGPARAGFYIFGGTSSGSPQWAALTAIGAQIAHHSLGNINPALYDIGHSEKASQYFHDVTVGDNAYNPDPTINIPGYAATPGWDAATGWGTPIASKLVPFLADALG
jgi:subtilase family serine protease